MTLYDIIYEFYLNYIFNAVIYGDFMYSTIVDIGGYGTDLSDYFCSIATIITLVAIVLICCALIKKIYNMCAHIIG